MKLRLYKIFDSVGYVLIRESLYGCFCVVWTNRKATDQLPTDDFNS